MRRLVVVAFVAGVAATILFGVLARFAWGWGTPEPIDRATADSLANVTRAYEAKDRELADALISIVALRRDSMSRAEADRQIRDEVDAAREESEGHRATAAALRARLEEQPDLQAMVDSLEVQHAATVSRLEKALKVSNAERLRLEGRNDSLVALLFVRDSVVTSVKGERDFWRSEAERLEDELDGFDLFGWLPDGKVIREVVRGAVCGALAVGFHELEKRIDPEIETFDPAIPPVARNFIVCEVSGRLSP